MGKVRKRRKFAIAAVVLVFVAFVFGAATGIVVYATGKTVAYTPRMAMVSHTEYAYNSPGQIIARIVDFQGNPVAVTSCNATILYPNKSFFVNMAGMTPTVNIAGDFYYQFTTPDGPEGTYEYQATCFYGVNKNASVTNSFHLTPNFNVIIGNLSTMQAQLGNLSEQLNANVSTILAELQSVNSTLVVTMTQLAESVNATVLAMDASMAANFTQLQENVSQILAAIGNITIDVNFTEVLDAIESVNATITQLSADMEANFTYTNALIVDVNGSVTALSDAMAGNFSAISSYITQVNATVTSNAELLAVINTTTVDIYTYVTGTLTNNLDDVLTNLGVINATVNRIETTTSQINGTVNQILQNQQDRVYMDVFSG
jgi:hypothetical protein